MTVDTGTITDGVNQFVQLAIAYTPLGLAIVGVPVAISIALKFGYWIAHTIENAFG